MKKYAITVHQTDERMYYLEKMLRETKCNMPAHVFAPNVVVDVRTLASIEDGALVFLGRTNEEAELLANSRNIAFDAYSNDEKFQSINSRLTAEGTLKIILERSPRGLADVFALVIGFGRTGAAVAKIFSDAGVRFDVASTSSVRQAYALAQKVVRPQNFDFSPYNVIVNTVPKPIIADKDAMTLQEGTLYIDLASSPAINLEYANYLGADASIYPALPAKVAPYSAAKAIFDYITEVLNGKY